MKKILLLLLLACPQTATPDKHKKISRAVLIGNIVLLPASVFAAIGLNSHYKKSKKDLSFLNMLKTYIPKKSIEIRDLINPELLKIADGLGKKQQLKKLIQNGKSEKRIKTEAMLSNLGCYGVIALIIAILGVDVLCFVFNREPKEEPAPPMTQEEVDEEKEMLNKAFGPEVGTKVTPPVLYQGPPPHEQNNLDEAVLYVHQFGFSDTGNIPLTQPDHVEPTPIDVNGNPIFNIGPPTTPNEEK